jgi:hypothetical protein
MMARRFHDLYLKHDDCATEKRSVKKKLENERGRNLKKNSNS